MSSSSHNKQAAVKDAVNEEAETELRLLMIHGARTGEELRIVPGTSFIDDRAPITHGRSRRK